MKDTFALESFCDGYSDFENSGLGGDLKENIRYLALGTDRAKRKILVELDSYERLKTLFLEIPRWANWHVEAEVDNLEATWRSRFERENAENRSQSEGNASIEVGDQEIDDYDERLPKILWLTEAKLRQKSNRERVSQSSQ
jgi:post-segregation antitoxin (ccd killing protein)